MAAILFITYKWSRWSTLGLSQLLFVKEVSTQTIKSNIVHILQHLKKRQEEEKETGSSILVLVQLVF